MTNKIKIVFVLAVSILLFGCGPNYQTIYTYNPPDTEEGRTCVAQCQHSKIMCEKLCSNDDNSECMAKAKELARLEYNEYLSQQNAVGKRTTRSINSFYDSRRCSSASCNCVADFRACFTLCGGHAVPKHVEK